MCGQNHLSSSEQKHLTGKLVVPFTLWARGRLRRAGVLRPARARDVAQGLALAGAATAASHAVARRIRRARP